MPFQDSKSVPKSQNQSCATDMMNARETSVRKVCVVDEQFASHVELGCFVY
jgi:hypothetical protein